MREQINIQFLGIWIDEIMLFENNYQDIRSKVIEYTTLYNKITKSVQLKKLIRKILTLSK